MEDLHKISVKISVLDASRPAWHCWQWMAREGPKGTLIRKVKVSWKYLVAFKLHFFPVYFLLISIIKYQYYSYRKREGMNE